jgi:hypothetical protein
LRRGAGSRSLGQCPSPSWAPATGSSPSDRSRPGVNSINQVVYELNLSGTSINKKCRLYDLKSIFWAKLYLLKTSGLILFKIRG